MYSVSDAAGNKATRKRTVFITPDITPPVVQFNGKDTLVIEVFTAFVDPGASASDKVDGQNLAVSLKGTVDTAHLGIYFLDYTAEDKAGNQGSRRRVVKVVDTQKPLISFKKGSMDTVEVFHLYNDDIVAKDNYDSNLIITREVAFDFSDNTPKTLDTFTIRYIVKDHSGNSSELVKTVYVVDTTAPVISIIGSPAILVPKGHTYVDSGYTVKDNYDQHPKVVIGGTFTDTRDTGDFYIQYTATDQSGNKSHNAFRFVRVEDNTGIEEITETDGSYMKAYPNPATGLFTIEASLPAGKQAVLAIFDLYGRKVREIDNGNKSGVIHAEVDMQAEAAGIYFLRMEMKDRILTYKIAILR
jgi:hypothetical protein